MNNATIKTAPENSGLVKVQLSNVINRSNKSNCWFLLSDMLDPLATSNQIATSKHQIQVCHEQCPLRLSRYIENLLRLASKQENCKGQINILYYTIINCQVSVEILFGPPSSIFHLYGKARVNDWNLVFCNLFWFFLFIVGEAPQLLKGRLASMSFHKKVFKWNVARLRFICKSFMWKLH